MWGWELLEKGGNAGPWGISQNEGGGTLKPILAMGWEEWLGVLGALKASP